MLAKFIIDFDRWVTPDEAARFLGVQPDTLQKWRRKGQGPNWSTALGERSPRYWKRDLIAFMNEGSVANTIQAEAFHRQRS